MPEIAISTATAAEREECYRLAYEVYCGDMGTMRNSADHERGILMDPAIEKAHILRATVDGVLAGTLGILTGEETPFAQSVEHTFDIPRYASALPRTGMALNIRFAVREQFRSSLVPFRLIVESGRYHREHGIQLVFCDCQPHLLNLYENLGLRPCAPVVDKPGFGVMVPLALIVSDFDHMRSVRSPLLRYFPKEPKNPELASRLRALLPEVPPAADQASASGVPWSEAYGVLNQSSVETSAFHNFSQQELAAFLERSQILHCITGQRIISEGQSTRTAYVVLEGTVEVRWQGAPVARLTKGEMFGEFALLLDSRRTADVFAASENVRLLVLDERTLQRVLTSHAELATKFLLNLSRSLARRLLAKTQ